MHSYQQFVQETIDWTRVRQRLSRFSHIGVAFPEATLRRFAAEPPFYCHYMSWRLGTWSDDRPFVLMDEMLDYAGMKNLYALEMADFWRLLGTHPSPDAERRSMSGAPVQEVRGPTKCAGRIPSRRSSL